MSRIGFLFPVRAPANAGPALANSVQHLSEAIAELKFLACSTDTTVQPATVPCPWQNSSRTIRSHTESNWIPTRIWNDAKHLAYPAFTSTPSPCPTALAVSTCPTSARWSGPTSSPLPQPAPHPQPLLLLSSLSSVPRPWTAAGRCAPAPYGLSAFPEKLPATSPATPPCVRFLTHELRHSPRTSLRACVDGSRIAGGRIAGSIVAGDAPGTSLEALKNGILSQVVVRRTDRSYGTASSDSTPASAKKGPGAGTAAAGADAKKAKAKKGEAGGAAAKEMHMGPRIASHDLGIKVRKMEAWLEAGIRVLLVAEFNGEDQSAAAAALVDSVLTALAGKAVATSSKQRLRNTWTVTLRPVAPHTAKEKEPGQAQAQAEVQAQQQGPDQHKGSKQQLRQQAREAKASREGQQAAAADVPPAA